MVESAAYSCFIIQNDIASVDSSEEKCVVLTFMVTSCSKPTKINHQLASVLGKPTAVCSSVFEWCKCCCGHESIEDDANHEVLQVQRPTKTISGCQDPEACSQVGSKCGSARGLSGK